MHGITHPSACLLRALASGKVFGMDIIEHTGLPTSEGRATLTRVAERYRQHVEVFGAGERDAHPAG